MSTEFWDERYSGAELAYGEEANDFLVGNASRFPKQGKAIDLGAGEGRNALFLASCGLEVLAVDQSAVGMRKAGARARDRGLILKTRAADLRDFDVPPGSVDVVSSIFVHLPAELRRVVHRRIPAWLKPGGLFIFEAYAPDQLKRNTGGPRDPELLAPLDVILSELEDLAIEHQAALVRNVSEGRFHTGEASVIQVVARKR